MGGLPVSLVHDGMDVGFGSGRGLETSGYMEVVTVTKMSHSSRHQFLIGGLASSFPRDYQRLPYLDIRACPPNRHSRSRTFDSQDDMLSSVPPSPLRWLLAPVHYLTRSRCLTIPTHSRLL